jgi:hypothetical protein
MQVADPGAGNASTEGSVSAASKAYRVFKLTESGAIAPATVRMVRAESYLD